MRLPLAAQFNNQSHRHVQYIVKKIIVVFFSLRPIFIGFFSLSSILWLSRIETIGYCVLFLFLSFFFLLLLVLSIFNILLQFKFCKKKTFWVSSHVSQSYQRNILATDLIFFYYSTPPPLNTTSYMPNVVFFLQIM